MKIRLLFFFIIFCFFFCEKIEAQSGTQKKIAMSADWSYHDEENFPGMNKLVGNVVFKHDDIIGYCDSSYHFVDDNWMIAFGNPARIHINDSVTLYGRKVYYYGNSKFASIARNVILKDNTSSLYTDSLIYDISTSAGYYLTGGKMFNQENTLTSKIGHYYTNDNMVYLYGDVILVNESYTMNCDSLRFNTQTETVYFICRTDLISDENYIVTHSGWYDTKEDLALLIDSVEMYHETQRLSGDTVYYDKKNRFGTAWCNVTLADTSKGYIAQGDYAEYMENGGISIVTDNALLILIDNQDSLYLHADTLKMYLDTVQEPLLMLAYNRVKFFRNDLQGVCDSMSYMIEDSLLIMYFNPVIWSGENQLFADTIKFTILDSVNTKLELCRAGFITSSLYDDTEFNQIKGANITGYIYNRELLNIDVIGNAESVYYIQDDDSLLIGINVAATSEIQIFLNNNKISDIRYYNNPDGNIYPDAALKPEERTLKGFRWLDIYRPKKINDIFHTPIPR